MKVSTKQAIQRELKAARDISDTVEQAGRDFTGTERSQVAAHMAKASELKKTADYEDGLRTQLHDLTDGLGLFPPDSGGGSTTGIAYSPSGSKARRGADWGDAVVKANSDGVRFKGVTPSGSTVVAVPAPMIVELGKPVTTLRSLIPAEPTEGRYSFFRQITRTNNAAVVAPGALKPTSLYETVLVEDRARVIAHLSQPQSRMDFADSALLGEFVSSEMVYGLERALEAEIIGGDGTGEHLLGLNSTSGVQTQAYATSLIVTTRKAVTKLETSGYTGTGWVMAPSDWEAIELAATTTGSLLVTEAGQQAPIESSSRRLWGSPVVTSPACPVGVAYHADFAGATKLWVRQEATIDWSENTYDPDALGAGIGASDFARNLIRFRAEGRFGWAVLRPDAVVKVDLTP